LDFFDFFPRFFPRLFLRAPPRRPSLIKKEFNQDPCSDVDVVVCSDDVVVDVDASGVVVGASGDDADAGAGADAGASPGVCDDCVDAS